MDTETKNINIQNEISSTGIILRNARKKLGLSQKAVAERLCLKVSTIRNIEENKVPKDISLTFLRGYIKLYAKLVHISEESLITNINQDNYLNKEFKIKPIQNFNINKNYKKFDHWLLNFSFLIFFIVSGLTFIWWRQNKQEQLKEITMSNNNYNIEPDNLVENLSVKELKTMLNKQSSSLIDIPNNKQYKDPFQEEKNLINDNSNLINNNVNMVPVPIVTSDTIEMNFIEECWLEVIDSTGKKLFSGTKNKNSNLSLIGQPPYKLKIAIPSAVNINYKGKSVDLSKFIKSNRIARLTINNEKN